MSDLRILIVDDSVATRRVLTDAIEAEPGLAVCGAAPNGLLALELLSRTRPDLVLLDLEMPVMDGLEFLSHVRPDHPKLPVLVFTGTAGHANEATLEAMWRGASDYVLKPRGLPPQALGPFLRAELLPRVRALGAAAAARAAGVAAGGAVQDRPRISAPAAAAPAPFPASRGTPGREPMPAVVLVGASTGGPRALAVVLSALPQDFAVPVVVVQHMPAEMTEFFAAGLAFNCPLPVRLAEDGADVACGIVWVAPGGTHLVFSGEAARARFRLEKGPEQNGCRPAVDPMLRSAAQVFGRAALAIVLTGMGHDGLEGARAIRAAGGRVFVQDEASSVIWGMPGAIARAGLADAVVPLEQLGGALVARAHRGARARRAGGEAEAA